MLHEFYNYKMIQQQELEKVIDNLNHGKLSTVKAFKHLKIVVKSLQDYTSNPDTLPSETLIPCALFSVPEKLSYILSLKEDQFLEEKPEKLSYDLLLQLYFKSLLKLCHNSSEEITHVVVEGMSRSITLLNPYPKMARKWVKTLINLWSSTRENLNVPLRCHLAISKYLAICSDDLFMWALRRLYVGYFQNCKQVSWRNYQHINLMINSFCEIIKINPDRSYYVLFGYLRSISLLLDKLNKAKKKEKVEMISKLFSYQILNCFKLFSSIICRVESSQITALIYPLCELIAAYERITQASEFIPLKLHLLDYQLKIMEGLHIYIPHALQLIKKLLNNGIFNRKISKKSEKVEANLQIAYKLSKNELTQSHLLNDLFKRVITRVYMFEAVVSTNIGGSEVISQLYKFIKNKPYTFSGYKYLQTQCAKLFKADSQLLSDLRRKMKMCLSSQKEVTTFLKKAKTKDLGGFTKFIELRDQEEQVLKMKLAAENQNQEYDQNNSEQERDEQVEDDDEVNSGWEEASEGASEYNEPQSEDQSEKQQSISYEGDPDDIDNAVQMWDEEEWDSQDDIDGP